MRLSIEALLDYQLAAPADLLLAVEVAQLPDQRLVTDGLSVSGVGPMTPLAADDGLGRRTWTMGQGRVVARYAATVDIERPTLSFAGLIEDEKRILPPLVVPYLWPSRYCEADRFEPLVRRQFGELHGGDKVQAMVEWIRDAVDYVSGTSDATTTAADIFVSRQGVCRDFAHLLIALVRAAGIPARMVSAYAWALDPQDFHAVVEVWLEGAWHLVDPTGLVPCEGIARICVGRDATDISFLTIFGQATLNAQSVTVARLDGDGRRAA